MNKKDKKNGIKSGLTTGSVAQLAERKTHNLDK